MSLKSILTAIDALPTEAIAEVKSIVTGASALEAKLAPEIAILEQLAVAAYDAAKAAEPAVAETITAVEAVIAEIESFKKANATA